MIEPEQTAAEKNQIEEWKYDDEHGVWVFLCDDVNIFVSFWKHERVEGSWLAAIRWEYDKKNYGTHLKIQNDSFETEEMLIYAAGFVTKWLADNKEKSNKNETEYTKI